MDISAFLTNDGWFTNCDQRLPGRDRTMFSIADLKLSDPTLAFLQRSFPKGLYKHQLLAIKFYLEGRNVCLTTGTASGKSLAYYVAALETLQRDSNSRVLVAYPMKALGREQEDRWREAISASGLNVQVGRIDGNVHTAARQDILKRCRVLIATPDVVHAWILSNLSNSAILSFIRKTQLIVVDEVHSYCGVFGSNSAFLFRCLQHLMNILGEGAQYVGASATIADARGHLRKLFGVDFTLVGPEEDTSGKFASRARMVTPPRKIDSLSELAQLLVHLSAKTNARFLTFVDSRKQAEQLTSITNRELLSEVDEATSFKDLEKLDVLPFRAGYEERDRNMIQDRLRNGSLRGVVSTSALELGIDIPFLDTAVLIGVPSSLTSLHQRIGRIGRHKQGEVLIVNTGSVYDQAVFREPERLFERPMAEGALYLENSRLQYIHALCLARHDGEHDQVAQAVGKEARFSTSVDWPAGFWELCLHERNGEVRAELQAMKAESSGDPNHIYPLRDVESQFKIELRQGPTIEPKGSLSHSQLMREAYPGAVYYYVGQPYRVTKVLVRERTVLVRQERRYTTKPCIFPALYPNMGQGSVFNAWNAGELLVLECGLQVNENVTGFNERRGGNKFALDYPLDPAAAGIYFDRARFSRYFFTTGVLIMHPALSAVGVRPDAVAKILYEAFVMTIPFERQDIKFGSGKHRIERAPITQGAPFIGIYDQTYGSLRLSGRLCDRDVLTRVLMASMEIAENDAEVRSPETLRVLGALQQALKADVTPVSIDGRVDLRLAQQVRVILPGSKGLGLRHDNEEFEVAKVQFHPSVNGLAYRGRYSSTTETSVAEFVPIADLIEIPGLSRVAFYDYNLGEIVDESMLDEQLAVVKGQATPAGASMHFAASGE